MFTEKQTTAVETGLGGAEISTVLDMLSLRWSLYLQMKMSSEQLVYKWMIRERLKRRNYKT